VGKTSKNWQKLQCSYFILSISYYVIYVSVSYFIQGSFFHPAAKTDKNEIFQQVTTVICVKTGSSSAKNTGYTAAG